MMLKGRSTITVKGQTTIPKEIRKALKLKPGDRLLYELEKDRVILTPIRGTILDVAGTVKPKMHPEDYKKVRRETKRAVARRAAEEN
ncbi:MAG: type II toxin-antitoxin system PrlF family antitoxin [Actinomycetota bacterium]